MLLFLMLSGFIHRFTAARHCTHAGTYTDASAAAEQKNSLQTRETHAVACCKFFDPSSVMHRMVASHTQPPTYKEYSSGCCLKKKKQSSMICLGSTGHPRSIPRSAVTGAQSLHLVPFRLQSANQMLRQLHHNCRHINDWPTCMYD